MKMGGGGKKGGAFERWFCRELSLWWSAGRHDDLFWRTAGSGARAKVRSRTGRRTSGQYGDVQAVDSEGKDLLAVMTFELKRGYNKWCVLDLLDRGSNCKKSLLADFLQQAAEDAKNAQACVGALVARRDQREAVIIIPNWFVGLLRPELGNPRPVIWTNVVDYSLTIMRLEDFFKWAKPEVIRKHAEGKV